MPDARSDNTLARVQAALQVTAMTLLGVCAATLLGVTALGAAGAVPMLALPASLGETALDAGPAVQYGAALLLLAVLALVPGTARVRRLEAAHRSFRVGMDDVTRAYWAAHAADRAGIFTTAREFDVVRERLEFLRRHPDLSDLDPELLELAAQMSGEARDLARHYSDEKVARAETMLLERRAEADRLSRLIDHAHGVTREIRQTLGAVALEEDVVRSRIAVLREELAGLWTEIDETAPPTMPGPKLRVAAE